MTPSFHKKRWGTRPPRQVFLFLWKLERKLCVIRRTKILLHITRTVVIIRSHVDNQTTAMFCWHVTQLISLEYCQSWWWLLSRLACCGLTKKLFRAHRHYTHGRIPHVFCIPPLVWLICLFITFVPIRKYSLEFRRQQDTEEYPQQN